MPVMVAICCIATTKASALASSLPARVWQDNGRQLGVQVGRHRRVEALHMRQYQRVRQPVCHVEHAAYGIGQRMNGRSRRVGKRLSGQCRAQQHRLPRGQIGAVFTGYQPIIEQQSQRLARQHIEYEIAWTLASMP